MSFFISEAVAQAEGAASSPPGGDYSMIFIIAFMFIMMYFMMIRPQKKRQKEHQDLIASVSKGDEVVLTSGILGKVTEVGEIYASIDVGDETIMKFQKAAVHAVLPKGTIKSID